jgi:hypothetical protein
MSMGCLPLWKVTSGARPFWFEHVYVQPEDLTVIEGVETELRLIYEIGVN